jgi:hypothetical protein
VTEQQTTPGSNITFVISSFGRGSLQPDGNPDPFIGALKNSIRSIYSDSKILVSCNELPDPNIANQINRQIETARDNCKFLKDSPGSLKLVTHYHAWKYIDTEWAVFIDSDMLLLKNIDEYLTEDTDYIFTWRKKDMTIPGEWPWLNAGTMICRNTNNVRAFWQRYYDLMWKHAMFNRGDQFAFVELLSSFDRKINRGKELFKLDNNQVMTFVDHGIRFKTIHCDYLNRSAPFDPWMEETAIQHLKGIQGTIITKTEKENRYENFINQTLPNLSSERRKNLKIRIDLWKKFAPKEIADGVIDL